MKSIKIFTMIIGLLVIFSFISSCDKGFTEMNINKVDPTSLNPELVMNHAMIYSPARGRNFPLVYLAAIVQQVVSPFGTSLVGGNYNQLYKSASQQAWNDLYPVVVKDLLDVLDKAGKDNNTKNLYNIARIWKAYTFQILTDTYGNIPYFEAGKGFIENKTGPKYDSQQAIYTDLLKELDEASAALSTSLPLSSNDIMYGGDVNKWKRLGYSLLLRTAMRLSKVDPALAQTYVTKAIAGGLMQSNLDNAVLKHNSTYQNPIGQSLNGTEKANYYLTKPFVDFLKSKNDPRLPLFAVRYVGAINGTQQTSSRATSDPSKQIGMPMGYDDITIVNTYAANGVASLWDYSATNIAIVTTVTAPHFFVSYSQTQFLLAEAVIRGWTTGDASAIYRNAIQAHMAQMAGYGSTISADKISAYTQANPLNLGNALEEINTQYWVASFLDWPEAFSNFRRCGYPALAPNPYPGSEVPGAFIRRLVYPDSEYVINSANLQEAVNQQGVDNLATRVWWDK